MKRTGRCSHSVEPAAAPPRCGRPRRRSPDVHPYTGRPAMLDTLQYVLGAGSGVLVGFVLGLVGGGGSILAVPLMVYLVGVPNPHVAIGTSALAVAANALTGLLNHIRRGHVKWRCSLVFAAAGVAGAFAGSSAGKAFDGERLLFLFAVVMVVVGVLMLRNRMREDDPGVVLGRDN